MVTETNPSPDPAPRSRRSVLVGALGGLAGLAAGVIGLPKTATAAAGDPLFLGSANDAGTANTTVKTTSSGIALQMNNLGSGVGGYMLSTGGVGLAAQTSSSDRYAGSFTNQAPGTGFGAAVLATGKQNNGVIATTEGSDRVAGWFRHSTAPVPPIPVFTAAIRADGGVHGGIVATTNYFSDAAIVGLGLFEGDRIYGQYTDGVRGEGSGNGVFGIGRSAGVRGDAGPLTDSKGVHGTCDGPGIALVGQSYGTGLALQAIGDADVTGTLTKAQGMFKIDHPLEPESKYLFHSFVESPEMKNVYDGVVELDAHGEATVRLPAWFEALNSEFRYQLTPLGRYSPLYVKSEVRKNRFSIAGGAPGQAVSWQVTGIRQDAYARAHPIEVEVTKVGKARGRYLHPTEHGQPRANGIIDSGEPTSER
jgi:hypothetical protein